MTYTPPWKKRLILVCGLLENLIFTGSILGWSALNHMLKQEGVYEHHCVWMPKNLTNLSPLTSSLDPNISGVLNITDEDIDPINIDSIDGALHSRSNADPTQPEGPEVTDLSSSASDGLIAIRAPSNRTRRQIEVDTEPESQPITELPGVGKQIDLDTEPLVPTDNQEVNGTQANATQVPPGPAPAQPQLSAANLSANDPNMVRVCKKQDTILNLAYTIGTFLNGFTAFMWGFLLDRWGLRIVRLVINAFLTAGCVMLCFTTRENSHLIFPAVSLLCLGGVPLRIADMQFANLFPTRRSSVITFYSGAFSASSIIFVLLKYVYEFGVSFRLTCFVLVLLSLLMLPVTLFLLPADRVREDDEQTVQCPDRIKNPPPPTEFQNPTFLDIANETGNEAEIKFTRARFSHLYQQNITSVPPLVTLQKFAPLVSPVAKRKSINGTNSLATIYQNDSAFDCTTKNDLNNNLNKTANGSGIILSSNNLGSQTGLTEKQLMARLELIKSNLIAEAVQSSLISSNGIHPSNASSTAIELPLSFSLKSFAYLLHQWWFSWLITYMIMYVGSMGLWISRVTEDAQQAGQYLKIYGLLQVLSLAIAPMAGCLMDYQVSKARCEQDPFQKRLKMAQSGFWPILATTVSLAAVIVCKLYDHETAVYVSIVFNTILRSFLVAVATAYLRIRFPAEHFNKLLGIMSTVGAFVTLLQFPLFILESTPDNVIWVHLFNASCTLLAFLNPLLLLVNPLQHYLIRKEMRLENEFRLQTKQ